MKKADKPSIVININVYGDNNKVSTNETRSHVPVAVIIIVLIAALYPKFTPAQIRLPKQFVLLSPTPNHLTQSQRNTHTY